MPTTISAPSSELHLEHYLFNEAPNTARSNPFEELRRSVLHRSLDLFGFTELNEIYQKSRLMPGPFSRAVLDTLGIDLSIDRTERSHLPSTGPSIVVSNHPFGGVEGLILDEVLSTLRPDVKIVANYLLGRVPELRDRFILVDPFDKRASKQNLHGMREALEWVKAGHQLVVFPAGEVSNLKLKNLTVEDSAWSSIACRLATKSNATITPIFFEGYNSNSFQILGLLHPRIRTALLVRELLNKCGSTITLRIGSGITPKRIQQFQDSDDATQFVRSRTYVLKHRNTEEPAGSYQRKETHKGMDRSARVEPDARVSPPSAPKPQLLLQAEIVSLDASHLLLEQNQFQVFAATKDQIPHVLHEIGRLREITFRGVGEGTGNTIDLDLFDEYYTQLFVWNKETSEIVGGYRLGLSDTILKRAGVEGFYTNTLFHFRTGFFEHITPAIELGRSFVREEYQRSFAPLMLLWKGIARFVVAHPQYKILFGPVSISKEYRYGSRKLMVEFLRESAYDNYLSSFVRARTPFKGRHLRYFDLAGLWCVETELEDISSLVSELEGVQKGVPILLKQYLKLGGKILGFNIDPDFQDSLDSLILVDLTQTPIERLGQYMGSAEAEEFLRTHGK